MEVRNTETYRVYTELLHPMLYMQTRGIRVDTEGMRVSSEALSKLIEERQEQLNKIVGRELNTASWKQKQDYFYGEKGIAPYKDRKTGKDTTDAEALKRIARKGFKEASIILEMMHAQKLKSSYLEVKLGEDKRLRSAFGFTRSGRLTSSEDIFGEGLNVQTFPHPKKFYNEPNEPSSGVRLRVDFRKFILADEGYILYNLDKAQAENRIVAYIAPDLNMIDAFERGIDIHKRTASLIFGKPIEEISSEDGSCSLGNGSRSERYFGKEANHALNYGLGVDHFAMRLEVSNREAKMIIDKYFSGYPGVRMYHNWVQNKLKKDRTLINCFGRAYNFLDRIGDDTLSDALYFIPQSTVGDLINRWGILRLWKERATTFDGLEILNQIHDAIMFQIPISLGVERHWEMIETLNKNLNQELEWKGRRFSIPTDLKVGLVYADMDELKGNKFNKENFVREFEKWISKQDKN